MMELPPIEAHHDKRGYPVRVDRVLAVAAFIQQRPGYTSGQVARLLGYSRNRVESALMALDKRGLLLAEDDRGGLSFMEMP